MAAVLAGLVLLLAALLLALWLLRFRLADRVVDRRLAAAGVPGQYRITRLGPWHERLEDVRLGPTDAPDLRARRVDVHLGYRNGRPYVRGLEVSGLWLRAREDAAGLHLGALDRLLPAGGSGPVLPNLHLAFSGAQVALATPVGPVALTVTGHGNPQQQFRGQAMLRAPTLRVGGCTVDGVAGRLRVSATAGRPRLAGAMRIAGTHCPAVALGAGQVGVALRADGQFHRIELHATPTGFGGTAGPVRFAAVDGTLDAVRQDMLTATARLHLTGLSWPAARRRLAATTVPASLPGAAVVVRSLRAAAGLVSGGEATLALALRRDPAGTHLTLDRARIVAGTGAAVNVVPVGGIGWNAAGWRTDARVTGGGGGLPGFTLALRQPRAGATLTGDGQVAPSTAGIEQVALPALHFTWRDGRLGFGADLRYSGPVPGGRVAGLALPIDGRVAPGGRVVLGEGCRPLRFAALDMAAIRFGPGQIALCGAPVAMRGPDGAWRVVATLPALHLDGRTGSGAPVSLASAGATITPQGFTAHTVTALIGAGEHPTRLAAGTITGRFGGTLGGSFADGSARIGTVPLLLQQLAGDWRLADGTLTLAGGLRVADAAPDIRFRPLIATNARLVLAGSRIRADAMLREPATGAAVTEVTVAHDLATGRGHATLDVAALRFAPGKLQPDQLTPLTLGVVANVAGTITGAGQIEWTGAGVTSTGRLATDGLDLAAAFGPVQGIKGTINFSDLLGLRTPAGQQLTVALVNPGLAITDGVVSYHLPGDARIAVEGARWPFAGGTLVLEPALLDLSSASDRYLTFRIIGLDAAAFVQQLDFPNIAATGTFDGVLPMRFGQAGGRVVGGEITARPPGGTLAYVGELSQAALGRMGRLAFDALKAIRYSTLSITLAGPLDGEMVSRVRFTGVREATPERGLAARLIRDLPFRFGITIHAPFRALAGTARTYADPELLLRQPLAPTPPVQPADKGAVR